MFNTCWARCWERRPQMLGESKGCGLQGGSLVRTLKGSSITQMHVRLHPSSLVARECVQYWAHHGGLYPRKGQLSWAMTDGLKMATNSIKIVDLVLLPPIWCSPRLSPQQKSTCSVNDHVTPTSRWGKAAAAASVSRFTHSQGLLLWMLPLGLSHHAESCQAHHWGYSSHQTSLAPREQPASPSNLEPPWRPNPTELSVACSPACTCPQHTSSPEWEAWGQALPKLMAYRLHGHSNWLLL